MPGQEKNDGGKHEGPDHEHGKPDHHEHEGHPPKPPHKPPGPPEPPKPPPRRVG